MKLFLSARRALLSAAVLFAPHLQSACLSEYEKDTLNRLTVVYTYLHFGSLSSVVQGEAFEYGTHRSVYDYSSGLFIETIMRDGQETLIGVGKGVKTRKEAQYWFERRAAGDAGGSVAETNALTCEFSFRGRPIGKSRQLDELVLRKFAESHLADCSRCRILGVFAWDSNASMFSVFLREDNGIYVEPYFSTLSGVQYIHYTNHSDKQEKELRQRLRVLVMRGMLVLPGR